MRRLVSAAACVASLILPAAARADDAPYFPLVDVLPGLPGQFTPSTFSDCADGSPDCVDATLNEMYRRYSDLLAAGCDHNAVFALTYIRVTEDFDRAARTGFFEEPAFLAHEDAVFARLYFDARDAWDEGRVGDVAPAWRAAFEAARDRSVPGIGDMLLGMSAHVNRDMPFMLAGLGLVKPDGSSRKRDHDAFNQRLNALYDDVLAEIARRFDPETARYDPKATTADNYVIFQMLPMWREGVWRNAEMLTLAPTPRARAGVAQWIETYAVLQAQMIRAMLGYQPALGQSSEGRDAWCAANAGTAADARAAAGG